MKTFEELMNDFRSDPETQINGFVVFDPNSREVLDEDGDMIEIGDYAAVHATKDEAEEAIDDYRDNNPDDSDVDQFEVRSLTITLGSASENDTTQTGADIVGDAIAGIESRSK